ncbi:hypothetical protein HanXRQr2_Chr17g0817371 [Helianthus annuus]|uniref:Uncharacterized protein n=1 Tax=Helianthus annuus TaxID=4232 RepID=A0A9K3GVI1_HELAN|nr:hypothetical protein HanXRQr2_Chr17g0817371 [Helianthus annuus]
MSRMVLMINWLVCFRQHERGVGKSSRCGRSPKGKALSFKVSQSNGW